MQADFAAGAVPPDFVIDRTLAQMAAYMAVDTATGTVPIAGDLVDTFFPGQLLAAKALQRELGRLDGLLVELATLINMDRTLGGKVEYAEIGPPKFDELGRDGTSGIKACLLPVVLHYSSAGPLS